MNLLGFLRSHCFPLFISLSLSVTAVTTPWRYPRVAGLYDALKHLEEAKLLNDSSQFVIIIILYIFVFFFTLLQITVQQKHTNQRVCWRASKFLRRTAKFLCRAANFSGSCSVSGGNCGQPLRRRVVRCVGPCSAVACHHYDGLTVMAVVLFMVEIR